MFLSKIRACHCIFYHIVVEAVASAALTPYRKVSSLKEATIWFAVLAILLLPNWVSSRGGLLRGIGWDLPKILSSRALVFLAADRVAYNIALSTIDTSASDEETISVTQICGRCVRPAGWPPWRSPNKNKENPVEEAGLRVRTSTANVYAGVSARRRQTATGDAVRPVSNVCVLNEIKRAKRTKAAIELY